MAFRPLHDRILVRRLGADEKTAGGIIIPDTAKEKPMEGEVVGVGPGLAMKPATGSSPASRSAIAFSSANGLGQRSFSMGKNY